MATAEAHTLSTADRITPVVHTSFSEVDAAMNRAVADGVFPGATLLVSRAGLPLIARAYGRRSSRSTSDPAQDAVNIDTVYDVGALTNVVATTMLLMKLVENHKLSLSDRASRWLQGFGVFGKSAVTVGQLLSHTAGFVHWYPYFEELTKANAGSRIGILASRGAKEYVYQAIHRQGLKYSPGTRQIYSEVGFILLGEIVESLTGMTLDRAAQRFVFHPLGMRSTAFIDLSLIKRHGITAVTDVIAPTEECPWRKRVLCGEVQDDNAWAMGGVAGHSGVFSTANDLGRFASELLSCYHGRGSYIEPAALKLFWSAPAGADKHEGGFRFGWDTPSKDNGLLGSGLSADAVGHSSFTGCSMWLEPAHEISIILLSNRVHPSRSNKKIFGFRGELHRVILEALARH